MTEVDYSEYDDVLTEVITDLNVQSMGGRRS